MMRVLVTGCAGFIGSHLLESLLADGHDVVGVDCFTGRYPRETKARNIARALEWTSFTFLPTEIDAIDARGLAGEVDVIYHLAAEPGVRTSWGSCFAEYLHHNVGATQRLLEAIVSEPDAPRLVYASSSSVYGDLTASPLHESLMPRPMSPYAVTKLAAEQLCSLYHENHGVDAVSLRYFTVYGPRQRPDMAFASFLRAAMRGETLTVHGDGSQQRAFTYVADVVAATRRAGETPGLGGAVMNIGGAASWRVRETVALLEQLLDRPLDVDYAPSQPGDVMISSADCTKARALIGFEATTSFEDGLRAQLDWSAADQPAVVRR